MQILRAHFAFRGKFFRPVHNQRVGHATLVSFTLPSLKRCVARPSPAPRIVIVRIGCAEQINSIDIFFKIFRHEIEIKHFIERTLWSTFRTRAVVAHHKNNRVIKFTHRLNMFNHSAHLCIGVRQETCVNFHHSRIKFLFVGTETRPLWHPMWSLA